MADVTFQRARRPEHKAQRHEAIIEAARTIALDRGVRAATLTAIADATGIAKSNVLRYFETREDILLHVAAGEWRAWSAAVQEHLAEREGTEAVVDAITSTLIARPLFCDLLGHIPADLEHNVSAEAVTAYKLVALASVGQVAGLVQHALPGLREAGGSAVVAGTLSMAASLWQSANPPSEIAAVYRGDERLAEACVDFPSALPALVTALVSGLTGR